MARTVHCIKLNKEAEGLDFPPVPGRTGQEDLPVGVEGSLAGWLKHQTMLINENRLNLADDRARKYLATQMEKHFFGEGADQAMGYVPPALHLFIVKAAMTDPLRRLKDPVINEDGSLHVRTVLTPTSLKTRGLVYKGSNKVVPVIFIPGTMGTNLRVRRDVPLPPGYPLRPGEPAWRPPNERCQCLLYASDWKKRSPKHAPADSCIRTMWKSTIAATSISASCYLERSVMRERGWGEIFNGSYGTLLFELQSHLEMTFQFDTLNQTTHT
jgi:Fe-S cluster biosynthesis and repair protein YggX